MMATAAELRKHPGYLEVDWKAWSDLQRAIRKSADRNLPKRLGQANKRTGKFIISKLTPRPTSRAVGEGRGAAVRPSASRREVLLRVGGSHRSARKEQWGTRPDFSAMPTPPPRPHIRETVARHRDEIEQFWLEAVSDALSDAFYETSP